VRRSILSTSKARITPKPEESGVRAYDSAALNAMRKTGYAALFFAKVTMFGGRENIVIIFLAFRWRAAFTLHTMFIYENEVRAAGCRATEVRTQGCGIEAGPCKLIDYAWPRRFEPSQYVDTYRQELERLIEAKRSGKKLAVMPGALKTRRNVVDLMSALKTSPFEGIVESETFCELWQKPNKETEEVGGPAKFTAQR